YPSGQILPVELALEPFGSDKWWLGGSSADTVQAGLYQKDSSGQWALITDEITDFTFNSDGSVVTYDWDVLPTDTPYATQLMFVFNPGSAEPATPTTARYFARTYPFNITEPQTVGEATLWLEPAATTVSVGDPVDLDVYLDTDGEEVVGMDLNITYSATYLAKDDLEPFTSDWPSVFLKPGSPEGEIVVGVMVTDMDDAVMGDKVYVGTIHLSAVADTAGQATAVSFVKAVNDADGGTRVINVDVTDILGQAVGAEVIITPSELPTELSGTYFSRKFDLDADEVSPRGVKTLGTLTADYYQPATPNFVNFKIKFYDASGNPVPATGGEYPLNIAESGVGIDMDALFKQYTWFDQIGQIQFVIEMSTDNYLDSTRVPWVQSLILDYELNAATIGLINFTGETTKTAAQGASVNYDLVAMPIAGSGTGFVRAVLEVDWNGAVEGNGTKPTGMTVQFMIDGQLTNDSGNIWEFWLDENDPNYQPSGYPFQLRLTAGNDTPPADYTFHVVGSVFGDDSRTLQRTANPGVITVTGVNPGTADFELSFIGESSRSIRPGSVTNYLILVKSLNGFANQVTLSTNLSSQFTPATAVTAQFSPDYPITPTPEGYQVMLNVAVEEGTGNQSHSFTVTGTAGVLVHDLTTGILEINDQAPESPAITIIATVSVDSTSPLGTSEPRFYFRLYPYGAATRNAWVYQNTTINPSDFNGDQITMEVPEGLVADGQRYLGYIRSTRHLWKKSSTDFTVDTAATTQTYVLTFPTLAAGNIGPTPDATEFLDDDMINSLDYTQLVQEWVRIFTTLIGDFNEDGTVNSTDLPFIYGTNWGLKGDLLTNLPN
ncbi:hypothetical protein JXA59_00910, partial [Patescibacteria group bacterium]|nr:hypothetical protein [Patescibacteria group bacterium]